MAARSRTVTAISAAAVCFTVYACCHMILAWLQWTYGGIHDTCSAITIFTAIALVYDNGLLALGRTIVANPVKEHFAMLSALSQPRFFAHAFLTPLLALQATRLGERAGATWLAKGTTTHMVVSLSLIHI